MHDKYVYIEIYIVYINAFEINVNIYGVNSLHMCLWE